MSIQSGIMDIDRVVVSGKEMIMVQSNGNTKWRRVGVSPSVSQSSATETSITVRLENNDTITSKVYVEVGDTTPNRYSLVLSPAGESGDSGYKTLYYDENGSLLQRASNYTIYARSEPYDDGLSGGSSPYAHASCNTDGEPIANAPTIYSVSSTTSRLVWKCSNPYYTDYYIIIKSEIGDSTPDPSDYVSKYDLYSNYFDKNYLNAGSYYKVYAQAVSVPYHEDSPVVSKNLRTDSDDSGGGCLHYDTLIKMADGSTRRIYDLNEGDEIIGYSIPGMIDESQNDWETWTTEIPSSGEQKIATVKTALIDKWRGYYVINDDIKITKSHHLFARKPKTKKWGWIDSVDLQVGDYLFHATGEKVRVDTLEYVDDDLDIVDLDVEEVDNYFAGSTPILVHNAVQK
jgi:hypothetical protein